ncbi:MAG: iron-containing redox enzyme family protein [Mycobacteriales bacterium]
MTTLSSWLPTHTSTPLADALSRALSSDEEIELAYLWGHEDGGPRDRLMSLLQIYELHTAPIDRLGTAVRWQHHPTISTIKATCEQAWLAELSEIETPPDLPDDLLPALRTIAARNRKPAVYTWLANDATSEQVVDFLSWEGGPDAGFDDLVAACQIGLAGAAKMELATNYWDEMGDGEPAAVHTALHDRLSEALHLRHVPRAQQPTSALARAALGGLLATNRWLQPEMLGALGLIELEAGPRCRLVLRALHRVGAPADAMPFYEVHADVDPRHGKDWLEKALAPTILEHPEWAPRILRGALWREATNHAFLADIHALLRTQPRP